MSEATETQTPIILSLQNSDFVSKLAKNTGVPLEICEKIKFSDGNVLVKISAVVTGRDVILVQSLYGENLHEDLISLLFLADAARREGARKITAVIPYFSYAKADKTDGVGTSLRAAVIGKMLSRELFDELVFWQLHSGEIKKYLTPKVTEWRAADVWVDWLKEQQNLAELVLVAPDAGARGWVQELADDLGCAWLEAAKTRPGLTGNPEVVLKNAIRVSGKTALIIDDFTTTGGTLIQTGEKLLAAGARAVWAGVVHAPLDETGYQALMNSPLEKIVTTNTTEIAPNPKLTVLDASKLFKLGE